MKTELTPKYVNKRCEELGLVHSGSTTTDTDGWWSIQMYDGEIFEVVEWPRKAEKKVWVCFPDTFNNYNNHSGIITCRSVEDFEITVKDAVAKAQEFAVNYYNKSINEALKKLD